MPSSGQTSRDDVSSSVVPAPRPHGGVVQREPDLELPGAAIRPRARPQGPLPAPMSTCSVHAGQWKRSHCFERALLTLDDQHALADEYEEVLLRVLGVVEPLRLAGLQHVEAQRRARGTARSLRSRRPIRAAPIAATPPRARSARTSVAFRPQAVLLERWGLCAQAAGRAEALDAVADRAAPLVEHARVAEELELRVAACANESSSNAISRALSCGSISPASCACSTACSRYESQLAIICCDPVAHGARPVVELERRRAKKQPPGKTCRSA